MNTFWLFYIPLQQRQFAFFQVLIAYSNKNKSNYDLTPTFFIQTVAKRLIHLIDFSQWSTCFNSRPEWLGSGQGELILEPSHSCCHHCCCHFSVLSCSSTGTFPHCEVVVQEKLANAQWGNLPAPLLKLPATKHCWNPLDLQARSNGSTGWIWPQAVGCWPLI